MIYIFEIEEGEKVIAVIEADEGINFHQLFKEHKKEWYKDLKWDGNKYKSLCQTEGYDVARAYLQKWRDTYDLKIKTLGGPAVSFLSILRNYKLHHWSFVYLEESQNEEN